MVYIHITDIVSSKKTDFTVDLMWWGLLRLAQMMSDKLIKGQTISLSMKLYCFIYQSILTHNEIIGK